MLANFVLPLTSGARRSKVSMGAQALWRLHSRVDPEPSCPGRRAHASALFHPKKLAKILAFYSRALGSHGAAAGIILSEV
jgi:hypothetical protein